MGKDGAEDAQRSLAVPRAFRPQLAGVPRMLVPVRVGFRGAGASAERR